MGVCINYRLAQRKENVPKMLDRVAAVAQEIKDNAAKQTDTPVEIVRLHPYRLNVQIGNCETLCLGFGSRKHWEEKSLSGYSYEHSTLSRIPAYLESVEMMWCSHFCKTQYGEKLVEHKYVADLLKVAARSCYLVEVYDEGDYYHTEVLEDAAIAIEENGKVIAGLTKQLTDSFGADNVKVGGKTVIGTRKQSPYKAKK